MSFNFVVIDTENGGVCDRFETWDEARHAYPDYEDFKITRYTDEENAEIDRLMA